MDRFDVPGAAIAVVEDDEVYILALGTRDGSNERPVDADTMFYVASITKTFNAMAMCALASDDRIDLDDTVQSHLPRFVLPDANEEIEQKATLRDLLSHRWGINSGPIVLLDAYTGEITEDRYWHWLKSARVTGRPDYTNVNFTLAGKVIEAVTGMDWRDWLDERILEPAGMTRTTGYASRLYQDDNCAIPMEWTPDGFVPTAQRKSDRTMHAAGGLGLSPRDGARWIMLNLDDGQIGDTRVLPADAVEEMKSLQTERQPDGSIRVMDGFCLGWQHGTFAGVPMLAHGGGYVGTNAYVALHPKQDSGFFVFVNASGLAGGWGAAVSVDCSRVLTGAEPPWDPWTRFGDQADRIRGEREESLASADEEIEEQGLTSAHLTRPIGLYTGAFRNEWLGTLHVECEGETLEMTLGEMPRAIGPTAERDRFTLEDADGDARFVVSEGGEIDEVLVPFDGIGEVSFVR